ncbi:MAG: glycerol kinase GlpK [Atopobiaceae bacterium]|nr:glycerol kinase GlpK [Atopobiaceae bacterium]MCI2173563.1 glycerol kinase GlpK [Atopobiaceae bacterium]MCI2207795.1 glycerol kinase GlpK [Atopobiaceae bacterium]
MQDVLGGLGHDPDDGQGYVMALDAGTTSVRAILFDEYGCKVAQAQRRIGVRYPHPGWVEQDPVEILSRQIACMIEVQYKSGIHSDRIRAVGITNQRETVVVWDRTTGQPIYNAIVWQCRRTAPIVDALVADGRADLIRERTGLVPDAYFSGTKIKWILENVEGAREMADAGQLMCGTIDTWLIYNLTHGVEHATDYTNASRTMLFDIHKLDWDPELCEILGVPMSMLPECRPSSGDFGRVSSDIMTNHPPISGVAGDQQASLFGHCCFEPGSVKNTYGTGCFLLMNVGPEPVMSENGLVTTVGIAQGGEVDYALEGSVFQAGSVIQWLRDDLGLIDSAESTCEISRSVADTAGCYMVPAFTGLGAPWWDPDARGVLCGITRGTGRAHIVRAACESMAYQTYDILKAMESDSGRTLSSLEVDGGASENDFIMQFQADLLGIDVQRSEVDETTALGAAYLAGLAVGYWGSKDELVANHAVSATYVPDMTPAYRERLLTGWREALRRTLA